MEVTTEKLISITQQLRPLNKSWASDIAREISSSKEWKWKPCTSVDVRHLSTGKIVNDAKRVIFAKVAAKMIFDLQQTKSEAQDLIESIK